MSASSRSDRHCRAISGGSNVRVVLVVLAVLIGLLVWAGLAGGAQPFESYEASVVADGPVAQFRFSDAAGSSTVADSVGSYTASNSGIVLGGEGPFGGGASGSFGGAAFATLPADPLSGVSAFTAEAWVDWAGGASYKQPIFDFGSGSSSYMYLTPASALSGHKMLLEIHASSGMAQVTATKLPGNSWEYVAVSETSAGVLTLYLNGEQVGQTTGVTVSPASLGSNPPDDYLGKSVVSSEPFFDGSISNVAFYNKALSASRILAHYRAGEFPVNTALPTISGLITQDKVLSAKAGNWSGLEPVTFAYQWLRCNGVGGECVSIGAATATKYTLANEDVGRTIRVAVSASNSAGSGSATSAQTVPIVGIKPSNTALPAISGTAEAGQLLTAGAGSWEGSTPLSFSYAWELCRSGGGTCKSLSGVTGSSYRLLSSQLGMALRVIVTASNGAGSKSATSAVSATIVAGPPVDTALPGIFGTAQAGESLSASTGAWAGSEPLSYTYQWQSCDSAGEGCSNISAAIGSSYGLTQGDVGGTLRVVVTVKNSVASEVATSLPSLVVAGRPPSNTQPPGISGAGQEGQTLTANPGSWTGAEPISYTYQWERCSIQPLGSVGTGNGQFEQPGDVAVDYSGDLWVVDTGNDRVEEFNEQGQYLSQFGSEGAGNGQLSEPAALAVTREGDIWVADTGNNRLEEFGPSGKYITQVDPPESEPGLLEEPEGIAVDRDGDIWVSGTAEGELVEFNAQGQYLRTVGSKGSGAGQLGEPEGIAVDSQGHVWVADWSNHWVEEFNEQGEYLHKFGTAGAGAGQLESPDAVGVSPSGDVWVGDVTNDRVEEFNEHGEYLRQFGARGAAPGEFGLAFPMGLAVLANGEVWLTDAENDRLERFNERGEYLGGHCTAITGATGSTYSPTVADVGSLLQAAVTATDAEGAATAASSPTAVIGPAPPVNTRPPTIEGLAEEGQTFTASTGAWSGASLTYAYQWQSCNGVGEACADIPGAGSASYVVGGGEVGSTLRVVVSAENPSGKASSASSPTAVVAAGPPVNTRPPAIEGIVKESQTLSGSTGSWLGTAPLSYTYQWQSCNALGDGCIAIAGATSSTYLIGPSDLDTTLELTVTATNTAGQVSASSPRTVVVSSDQPEDTVLPSITGTAQEGQTLTASPGSWTGAQPISYSYQWQRCSPGLIGSPGSANGEFEQPGDVAISSSGDLWVTDTGNDRVEEFNEGGEYLSQFASVGSGNGQLSEPSALAITPEGDIWVADTGNNRVEEFSSSGNYITQIHPPESELGFLEEPEGVAVDRDGDVWVSDTPRGELAEFTEQGEYIKTVGSKGSGAGQLGEPEGLTVDRQGQVWVADWSNHRVEEFNEQGEYLQQLGAGSGAGQLESPDGIALSSSGDVWVANVADDRVEEFNEQGEYTREFGARGSAPGEFGLGYPMGLAVLPSGDVWLTDAENDRLERFNEHGEYLGGHCTVIPGGASTYSPAPADVGFTLQATVTAANADGEADATSLPTAVVSQGPPS
jgi:sugar lactone lactonase YvrE